MNKTAQQPGGGKATNHLPTPIQDRPRAQVYHKSQRTYGGCGL
ncbi:hypothetical protein [Desmospora activa]|uniref:Uncharacterized protein n=1 Tax=Desmospora activa DSM 45169 TaxID=1121389 RepID=A0A2T4YY83_9BACL|nr:hypothetical protein [Desmospora activa]PTM51507.1 hypothetical protein C8J48_3770 [Desmospora activa DSM 45169]